MVSSCAIPAAASNEFSENTVQPGRFSKKPVQTVCSFRQSAHKSCSGRFFQNAFQFSGCNSVVQRGTQIEQKKADAVNRYAEDTVASVPVSYGFQQHQRQTCRREDQTAQMAVSIEAFACIHRTIFRESRGSQFTPILLLLCEDLLFAYTVNILENACVKICFLFSDGILC